MTAEEAADHQWLKSTNCNGSQNQESRVRETRGQEVSPSLVQPLTKLESSETVGRVSAVSQRSDLKANNWLSSLHPFVSVSLSVEEEESPEMSSKETTRKSTKADHLSLSTMPPPATTCPLLIDQKGDTEEVEMANKEKDPTGEEENTIAKHIVLDQPTANVQNIRRKRAREEASKGILGAKKKRSSNFGAETEKTPLQGISLLKKRRGKIRKGSIAQGIKMRER